MDKDTIEKLREFAQRAREVAALVHQPGFPVDQFQVAVRVDMPGHPPDKALQSLERGLAGIAVEIDGYLRERAL
jgi:hypothetical protein